MDTLKEVAEAPRGHSAFTLMKRKFKSNDLRLEPAAQFSGHLKHTLPEIFQETLTTTNIIIYVQLDTLLLMSMKRFKYSCCLQKCLLSWTTIVHDLQKEQKMTMIEPVNVEL